MGGYRPPGEATVIVSWMWNAYLGTVQAFVFTVLGEVIIAISICVDVTFLLLLLCFYIEGASLKPKDNPRRNGENIILHLSALPPSSWGSGTILEDDGRNCQSLCLLTDVNSCEAVLTEFTCWPDFFTFLIRCLLYQKLMTFAMALLHICVTALCLRSLPSLVYPPTSGWLPSV